MGLAQASSTVFVLIDSAGGALARSQLGLRVQVLGHSCVGARDAPRVPREWRGQGRWMGSSPGALAAAGTEAEVDDLRMEVPTDVP